MTLAVVVAAAMFVGVSWPARSRSRCGTTTFGSRVDSAPASTTPKRGNALPGPPHGPKSIA